MCTSSDLGLEEILLEMGKDLPPSISTETLITKY